MERRITEDQCRVLYVEYKTPERVIGHCEEVAKVAVRIAEELNKNGHNFDIALIEGAGLAHDVARTFENHGEIGAKILESKGYNAEAEIVRVHMYHDFNPIEKLEETDMVCLGDRLVTEDHYVGLDDRIDYIIKKQSDDLKRTQLILSKKKETRELISKIESEIGKSLDDLFMKGNV